MSEHWSEIKTDDRHAEELAVIVHEGREFAAGGFYIDVDQGRMVGYVTQEKQPPEGFPYERPLLWLTTWGGEKIVTLAKTGISRGWYSVKLEHFYTKAPVAGYFWYGKGQGAGMVLRLKRGRKA